jgi:hypothetical protein
LKSIICPGVSRALLTLAGGRNESTGGGDDTWGDELRRSGITAPEGKQKNRKAGTLTVQTATGSPEFEILCPPSYFYLFPGGDLPSTDLMGVHYRH